jgi:hypothetical protein
MANVKVYNGVKGTHSWIDHRIGEALKFLKALEQNSVESISVTYKHTVEGDFSVYDQIPADLLDVEFLRDYLRRHIRVMLCRMKNEVRSRGNGGSNGH